MSDSLPTSHSSTAQVAEAAVPAAPLKASTKVDAKAAAKPAKTGTEATGKKPGKVAVAAAEQVVAAPASTVKPVKAAKAQQPAPAVVAKVAPEAKPDKPAKPAKAEKTEKASKSAKTAKVDKPAKVLAPAPAEPKLKLVRDSFTMPELEYAQLEALKRRALALAHHAKKSELLRAGVATLAAMDDAQLLQALQAVPPLKTGRPRLA
jgi:hypothetical protein